MIPTVRSLTASASASGSRLYVARSMSTKFGVAPWYSTTFAVEIQVKAGTITSSPGPSPSAATAKCRAVVPELVAGRVRGAVVLGECELEALDVRALHDPARLERELHGAPLLFAEIRLGNRDHGPPTLAAGRRITG